MNELLQWLAILLMLAAMRGSGNLSRQRISAGLADVTAALKRFLVWLTNAKGSGHDDDLVDVTVVHRGS